MSNVVVALDPTVYAGITWDIVRSPQFVTLVQKATSGREVRAQLQPYPTDKWSIAFDNLPQASDFAFWIGHFKARGGSFDSWLITVPSDKSIAGQTIGLGNGSTTAFLMSRTMGGFAELVENCAASAVYLAGVSIPTGGLSAPGTPVISSVSSGALAGATYFVKNTLVTNSGETVASVETNQAITINHVPSITSPGAVTGAIGWNCYISTTTGTETKQNGSTPVAIGTPFQLPNSGLIAGSALPGANTTGWSITTPAVGYLNTLTFAGAVVTNIAVTADFTYSWRVRFADDTVDFTNFVNSIWNASKIDLVQVLN